MGTEASPPPVQVPLLKFSKPLISAIGPTVAGWYSDATFGDASKATSGAHPVIIAMPGDGRLHPLSEYQAVRPYTAQTRNFCWVIAFSRP